MPDSESIIISAMAFVAETEEKAIEEAGNTSCSFSRKNGFSSELAGRISSGRAVAETLEVKAIHPKLTCCLKRIGVPTLILWGTKDRIIPFEQSKVWTSLISTSEIETFEWAGHLLFFEAPKVVNQLASFLAK
jgi:pimeloyl-ACP methyl ester carboxylesterase